jgi:ActR/RegA family two-component response regulator
MKHLLVIEDGNEYTEFSRLFLRPDFVVHQAQSAQQALKAFAQVQMEALLIDLRFDRAPADALLGDVAATAGRMFGGNQGRALRYLQDQQGVLILAELRARGHAQLAVFIHDFPAQRLGNLRKLYGAVSAVPTFDAAAIRKALQGGG